MKYSWCFILAAIALTPAVSAQELEEIVVSAQRREESLQDVPVSITAIYSRCDKGPKPHRSKRLLANDTKREFH